MTDWSDIAVAPDTGFATRLENALLTSLVAASPDTQPTTGTSARVRPTREGDMMTIQLDPPIQSAPPRRPRWLAAAAAVILLLGAAAIVVMRTDGGAPADATDVTFEVQWPGLADSQNPRCVETATVYESARSTHCLRGYSGEARLTGGVDGVALFDMAANQGAEPSAGEIPADLATFNATYLVKGTVAGCGTGEFMIAEVLRFLGWENGQFDGTWQVMRGSGRGELAGISGSGIVDPSPLGAGTDEDPRTHSGTIDCG